MKYAYLFMALLVLSCGNSKEKEIDKLADEVMVLHDEVMPITDDLYKTRMALLKRVHQDSSQRTDQVLAIITQLEEAENAMFDWMRNFNLQYKGETQEDTYTYFVKKKKSMEALAEEMRAALEKGKEAVR